MACSDGNELRPREIRPIAPPVTEAEAYIALNMVPHVGPVRLRRLLAFFGSATAILQARPQQLREVEGIGPEASESIAGWEKTVDLSGELRRVEAFGAHVVTPSDAAYPPSLKEIHDPPIVLYVWGELSPRDAHSIAVVGTRKPTHYAMECTKKLSYQLAYSGLTVVSGLARGIDTAAHQAALAAKGRTIAVLGSGLECLYPAENQDLAEKIAASGAVVTEFPMQKRADRQTFPMRNRIITGLAFGLLVAEAGLKSGSLISATQAGEQGRSLYAVPGRIDQPNAFGSNRLIQQGAKLVMSAQDILDDFGLLFREQPELIPAAAPVELSPVEQTLYASLDGEETTIDELVGKCGLPTHEVSSTLLALEMRSLVKQLPGSRFVKIL